MMAEESTRTKMIRETTVDDDMPMVKKVIRNVTLGASKLADKVGFTQEKEYADKTKEEIKVKKAKGGVVKSGASKRADGCAVRGKTRGKMV
jgi:hypothetical protein